MIQKKKINIIKKLLEFEILDTTNHGSLYNRLEDFKNKFGKIFTEEEEEPLGFSKNNLRDHEREQEIIQCIKNFFRQS